MSEPQARKQARYIFNIGKMLRQHVFTSLTRVEGKGGKCEHGDLSLAQLNMLLAVRDRNEVTLTELADILAVSPPSVSVMVERLVEKGLLVRKRATSDRRKVVIRVTPDEDQHIAGLEEKMVAAFVELVEKLGPETAEKWFEVLTKVEKVLQKTNSVPAKRKK